MKKVVLAFNSNHEGTPYAEHYYRGDGVSATPDLQKAHRFRSRDDVHAVMKRYGLNKHWWPRVRAIEVHKGMATLMHEPTEAERKGKIEV